MLDNDMLENTRCMMSAPYWKISSRHGQPQENPSLTLTAGDRAESFLPRCVPDLQFDPFVVEEQLLYFEVYAYRRDERGREAVF